MYSVREFRELLKAFPQDARLMIMTKRGMQGFSTQHIDFIDRDAKPVIVVIGEGGKRED